MATSIGREEFCARVQQPFGQVPSLYEFEALVLTAAAKMKNLFM